MTQGQRVEKIGLLWLECAIWSRVIGNMFASQLLSRGFLDKIGPVLDRAAGEVVPGFVQEAARAVATAMHETGTGQASFMGRPISALGGWSDMGRCMDGHFVVGEELFDTLIDAVRHVIRITPEGPEKAKAGRYYVNEPMPRRSDKPPAASEPEPEPEPEPPTMKIDTTALLPAAVALETLKPGSPFLYQNAVLIVADGVVTSGRVDSAGSPITRFAVFLGTGRGCQLDPKTMVVPVEATLKVERAKEASA